MGGNDHGLFGTLLYGCTQIDAIEHAPGRAPCREHYESYVASTYAEDAPEQTAALQHIKELAPNAKVFVVGYPEITPQDGHCNFSEFPWYPKDLQWFRDRVQKLGNKMIKAGAKANGAIFVDTFKPRPQRLPGTGRPVDRTADRLAHRRRGAPQRHRRAAGRL
jgi:hypothetical protein